MKDEPKDELSENTEEQVTVEKSKASEKFHQLCGSMKRCLAEKPMVSRVMLLVVAIIVGVAIKSALVSRITMGFQDYTLKNAQTFDFDAAEKRLAEKAAAAGDSSTPGVGIPTGGSCGAGL